MIKNSLLSIQVVGSDSRRIQRAMEGQIPFAILWQGEQPYIFFHGAPSVEGMKVIAGRLGGLKPSLLRKALFICCHGAYAPTWLKDRHVYPIEGELTLEWMEVGDDVAYFVYE